MYLDLTPGKPADCLLVPNWLAALLPKSGAVVADKAQDTVLATRHKKTALSSLAVAQLVAALDQLR